jgi:hypothetical protein
VRYHASWIEYNDAPADLLKTVRPVQQLESAAPIFDPAAELAAEFAEQGYFPPPPPPNVFC